MDKRYARVQLPDGKLGELVDLVSKIGFGESADTANAGADRAKNHARDLLGQVYEYFLGQFASAEGKRGGQFYTPASIVNTLVAVLAPHHGQVYDPCCGSGGMFVQSEKFIEAHGGKIGDVSIYGQEANPTTWRLAAMNLAIRGIDFNLGKEPNDTFVQNQHKDLRADFVLANPPFNISDWWHGSLEGDPRWVYGTPPAGDANYAWLQHILHHLKPSGRAGIVLSNGSMTSSQSGVGEIRRAMVDADKVEVMIALPTQLFLNTTIPACLWFLVKNKTQRQGEVLFIDARKLGSMISRMQCEFTDEVIAHIANTVALWRGDDIVPNKAANTDKNDSTPGNKYADITGFCRSVTLSEIAQHGHVLTPGRYVGAEAVEDDDEGFADKMQKLTEQLGEQMAKGAELDGLIRAKLGGWGMSFEWPTVEIDQVCDLIVDCVNKTAPVVELPTQYRMIRTTNIRNGRIDLSSCRFVDQPTYAKWTRRATLQYGDVLLTREAPIGEVGFVIEPEGLFLGQRVMQYRANPAVLSPRFLHYSFLSLALQHQFGSHEGSGSVVSHIRVGDCFKFKIKLPPLPVQTEIGVLLGALDDRISLLRETNTTLEAIAQALFKSWFVDFDPVRAKQQGSAPQGMDTATAALFPDNFEESELGEVPKGWRVLPVGDAVEAVGGATPDTKNPVYWESGTFCWTTPKDLSGIAAPVLLDTERKLSAQGIAKIGSGLLPIGTLLLSSRAPIGYLALAQVPLAINQGYIAMLPGGLLPPLYMLFWCQQNMDVIKGRANGSTFMEISKKAFRPIPALVPPSEVVKQFMEVASALFEKLIENEKQAQTLATLRDTLLPRLISGQLRLPA